jgi:chitin disaccharide deacetylase
MIMHPNPILKKLGFSNNDRLVIIHTDDIGMCQASVQAFADLWEFGTISSGAVMMPCPWAPSAAEYCRNNPGVDMGVHATLNAEWDTYRWGPLSTRDQGSGLLDSEGFFHKKTLAVQENADAESVLVELMLQIQRALEWGIDVTHLDTHMGTVMHPQFAPAYIQAGFSNRVPVMVPRGDAAQFESMGVETNDAMGFADIVAMLEEQGIPLIDHISFMPLDRPENQVEQAKKLLSELPSGVTHFILHPAIDSPEIRAIADDWQGRLANYKAFMSHEVKDFINNSGLQLIGYRTLRELL